MTEIYKFDEDDIKKALRETFLDKDKDYIITIEEIEAENYYGDTYKTIVAEAIPWD